MRLLLTSVIISFLFSSCTHGDDPTPTPPPTTNPAVDTLGNWAGRRIDGLGRSLSDVFFSTPTTGFVCGAGGTFFKTTDGGTVWQPITLNVGSDYPNIQFVNQQYGFMISVGGSTLNGIFRTINGGTNWQFASTSFPVNDIFFLNPAIGYCTSISGLYKSVDSAKNWVSIPSIVSSCSSLYFTSQSKGFVTSVGYSLYSTNDGANNFSRIINGSGSGYSSVYFANATNGCTGLEKKLYITNDGGANWSLLKTFNENVIDVKNTGPAEYYVSAGSEFWHTTDAGASWIREMKLVNAATFVELTLTQPGKVWVTASNGNLYYKKI
jgi:photosystem II stability/assembly factor-like uncharacterized protein